MLNQTSAPMARPCWWSVMEAWGNGEKLPVAILMRNENKEGSYSRDETEEPFLHSIS